MTIIGHHFDQLMPVAEQERIGATADRTEHMRVLRLLSAYNEVCAQVSSLQSMVIHLTQSRDNWECACKANDAVVAQLKQRIP